MNPLAQSEQRSSEKREAAALAAELFTAYRSQIDAYKERLKLSTAEAAATVEAPYQSNQEERILHGPPQETTWLDLQHLAHGDANLCAQRWESIKQAARDELRNGHRAGKAIEGCNSSPWQRAQ